MSFFRCVIAEWVLVRPRLLRTRFGPALLLLGGVLAWLGARGHDPVAVALHAGALGAVLGAAFVAGSDADRAALPFALGHPTTPLAVATGRWLAACLPAGTLVLACTAVVGGGVGAATAGLAAAGAVAGCALAAVLALGNGAALVLFGAMAVAGSAPPERLVGLAEPGLLRLVAAAVLELGPALWHYRDIAGGDGGALVHAAAWMALGIIVTRRLVVRLARRTG